MSVKYIRLAALLKEQISQNISSGAYKLPSEHTLCAKYQVSRQTVRAALALLQQEGLIEKHHGSGSFATMRNAPQSTIAIIVNNAEEYLTPALLTDLRTLLHPKGYTTQIHSTLSCLSTERKLLQELLQAPICGLIAEGTKTALPNPNLDLYEQLMKKGIPLLFLNGGYPSLSGAVCIKDDNYYGGYLLGRHLLQKGHRRIAALFKADDLQGPERYHGFLAALRDFDIPFPDELIGWYTSLEQEALEARQDTGFLTAFLRRVWEGCTAVICHNDEIAYWLIRELRYAKVRVPEDLSVVSFDNSYMSDLNSVRITSLSHNPHELGTAAADAMLRLLRREHVLSQELAWTLVDRKSDTSLL